MLLHKRADTLTIGNQPAKSRIVNVTASTLYLTYKEHNDRTVTINAAAGCAVRLPAASGSGARLRIIIGTTITSNSTTIKVANATDVMTGNAIQSQDAGATLQMFEAASTSDTITMDGSSMGGIKGDIVELEDIASGLWWVRCTFAGTGSEATPFSATVS